MRLKKKLWVGAVGALKGSSNFKLAKGIIKTPFYN